MKSTFIAVTPGDPAGIGPDIVLALARKHWQIPLVMIADKNLLQERSIQLKQTVSICDYHPGMDLSGVEEGTLIVWHHPLKVPCKIGEPDSANASYILNTLNTAAEHCLAGTFAAMVTGPICKAVINDAGIQFSGHTEYLANQCHTEEVVMMLVANNFRVALATTHLRLRDVPAAITREKLIKTMTILHHDLQQRFAIKNPRILVAGLNPHAGEFGHLGDEEIQIIAPAIDYMRQQNISIEGPIPADTLFTPTYLKNADAVLAMYHDQGLPVLKHVGFGKAVNITLGLPIIRTSVDHGTAFDLAGMGKADPSSLLAAVELAIQLGKNPHDTP